RSQPLHSAALLPILTATGDPTHAAQRSEASIGRFRIAHRHRLAFGLPSDDHFGAIQLRQRWPAPPAHWRRDHRLRALLPHRHTGELHSRPIGIHLANIGAYPLSANNPNASAPLKEWYKRIPDGRTRITIPAMYGNGGVRTPAFVAYPTRPDPVYGLIQGARFRQYDYTPQQYQALVRLTAALCTIFPKITCDYPRQRADLGLPSSQPVATTEATDTPTTQPGALAGPGEPGYLIPRALTPAQLDAFHG